MSLDSESQGIRVCGIWIHPVKSCRAIQLDASDLDEFGLRYDRIYMLVEPERKKPGHFKSMSQKRYPKIARLLQTIEHKPSSRKEGEIIVQNPDSGETLSLPLKPQGRRPYLKVAMPFYPREVDADDMGDEAATFFSDYMGKEARLAYRDPNREVYGPQPDSGDQYMLARLWPRKLVTACTDASPLHFITEESLKELSVMQGMNVEAHRFRPNFMLKGCGEAWEEEGWKLIDIEGIGRVSVVARCPRCSVPDVDIETGKLDRRNKPSVILKAQHATDPSPVWGDRAMFGMWAVHQKAGGRIKVGARVSVLRTGDHEFFYPHLDSTIP